MRAAVAPAPTSLWVASLLQYRGALQRLEVYRAACLPDCWAEDPAGRGGTRFGRVEGNAAGAGRVLVCAAQSEGGGQVS